MKKPELTPTEDQRPIVTHPKDVAAGIPAIVSSLKFAVGEAGPVRGMRELLNLNQKTGFDCPGCAWPDPDDRRSMNEYCENGAKAIAEEGTTLRADPEFFAKHSVAELAGWSDMDIGKIGRLTHPMVLREGATHYQRITWQESFDMIAEELNALDSPNEANFYTSGRTSNEAAFMYQLFIRLYGTNNLPDCSNMCHESSTVGLTESIGLGKGSVTLNDFEHTDCIIVIGQNPGTNHPRMLTTLAECSDRGAKIISINPLFETGLKNFIHPQHFWRWFGGGTPISTLHMPIRVNGDIAVLKGIMLELLAFDEKNPGTVFDHEFIRGYTDGYESMIANLRKTSWDLILQESGVSRENIKAAADIIAKSKNMIVCWAMGITQQAHGVDCVREIVNLLLLGGHFGRPGAGACPVRGHSNVQGDRTMGIYDQPKAPFLDALKKEFNFEPPREHGFDSVASIQSMHKGESKVFIGMGGNFLSANPDTNFTADALRKCRLTVNISTKPNRGHLVSGRRSLMLPCLGRTEVDEQKSGTQFVTVEDSMSVIHMSRGTLDPGSDQEKMSETAIVCGIALATFRNQPEKLNKANWSALRDNYDLIRNHIERVVPGFKDFNRRVRSPGGFYLPHPVRDSITFNTPTGKGRFNTADIKPVELPPGGLMLMSMRSHDQFNTTIYGLNDRYRGITNGRRVIFMNEADIKELGFKDGQWVDITSHFHEERRTAAKFMIVKYDIPKRSAGAYYPEANELTPIGHTVPKSNTPAYKSIMVTLAPAAEVGATGTDNQNWSVNGRPEKH